ncbi:MAG: SpoIID/LytB domain-containing protein [Nocardioidaceae bacterium]
MSASTSVRFRTRLWVAGIAATVIAPVGVTVATSTARADQTYYVPITKAWTISGHGYGHGHGMSQYGAQGAALQGLNYADIVDFYYPGTSWSKVKGKVRVLIGSDWTSDLQVKAQRGLTVRDLSDGTKWTLPTGDGVDRWRLTPAGDDSTAVQYRDDRGWHRWRIPGARVTFKSDGEFSAHGAMTLLVPSGSDVVGKRYRGILRSVRPYKGATVRDTVNVLNMDSYVKGVVPYEMPASWAQQALRAQAVAARTYAAWQRAQNPKRYYQICDTTACQVYGGVAAEQTSSNQAVDGTVGKILTYQNRPAFTQFSASSGGWTSAGGVPYLPAKKDRYDGFSGNSVHNWSVQVSASALERSHPEIGNLIDLRVTKRDGHGQWNGRALQIVLDGSDGTAYLTGDDFRWQYALRSNWFTIAPTPIIERWRKLGAAKSGLGNVRSGEYAVDTGSAQRFMHGKIFWNAATGAREVKGAILVAYRTFGGPESSLGWPRTGILNAPGNGRKVRFEGGRIYNKASAGAHVMYGPIPHRWSKEGGPGGWLGYPTTNVTAINGGQRMRFEAGVIIWKRATNTFIVRKTS